MPKKKGKKSVLQGNSYQDIQTTVGKKWLDVTINDSANAPKPVRVVKKSVTDTILDSWDEIPDDLDLIEEIGADGTKQLVYKKKKPTEIPVHLRTGTEYPEIIWYWISKYIRPEDVGNFARINKSTYAVTQNKAFWLNLYKNYCENHPNLPEKLRLDICKTYGLRQTVIRALFFTYRILNQRVMAKESNPHKLVQRKCVNVWYYKGLNYWMVYFKLKKAKERTVNIEVDFIEELGRIDANPEEDTQVLQVKCQNFREVPPLMGMTLTSLTMTLTQGFRHHKLHLGFNSSPYSPRGVAPELSVIMDMVVGVLVCDWWHPQYPHGEMVVPSKDTTILKKNFFDEDL